jgi:hypothetical protein
LPDLALNLFLSLRGHVELLTTRYLISPLPDYVENKVVLPKVLRLDEIAGVLTGFDHIAGFLRARHTAAVASQVWQR